MSENSLYKVIQKEVNISSNIHTYTFCRLSRYGESDVKSAKGFYKVSYDGDLKGCHQGDLIEFLDEALRLNISVDISKLDENARAYAGKSLDIGQSITAMSNSMQAMREYMGMTSGDFVFSDEDRSKSREALDRMSSTVAAQEMTIKATAEAITKLTTKVSNGPPPYNHSGIWKAMSVDNASHMQLPTGSSNIYHINIKIVDINNVVDVMNAFDLATGIKKCYYDSPCPNFYNFLDKVFCVWDSGDTPIIEIFRKLYNLTERRDFNKYCRKFGLETHYETATGNCIVYRQGAGSSMVCIHPISVRIGCESDYYDILADAPFGRILQGKSEETQADRIAKRMKEREGLRSGYGLSLDLSKGFEYDFNEEDEWEDEEEYSDSYSESNDADLLQEIYERRLESRSDRIPPSIAKEREVDDSMAKAMKAKRDGRFDVRMCSDGTMVRVGEHKPQLSMGEEIEQRLIEKYLT